MSIRAGGLRHSVHPSGVSNHNRGHSKKRRRLAVAPRISPGDYACSFVSASKSCRRAVRYWEVVPVIEARVDNSVIIGTDAPQLLTACAERYEGRQLRQ